MTSVNLERFVNLTKGDTRRMKIGLLASRLLGSESRLLPTLFHLPEAPRQKGNRPSTTTNMPTTMKPAALILNELA
jgi:hypothetical protein